MRRPALATLLGGLLAFGVIVVADAWRGDSAGDEATAPALPQSEDGARPTVEALRALGYTEAGAAQPVEPAGSLRVHGFVRDRDGRPLAGVDVRAKMEATGAPRVVRTVFTDAAGRYSIDDLPAGKIWVGLEQFTALEEPWALVTELAGDVEHDFVLPGALRLSGSVIAPLGGEVVLRLYSGGHHPEGTVTLQGSGRFAFGGLLPGPHRLRVNAERHATIERELSIVETTTGVTVDLEPAVALTGRIEPGYAHDYFMVQYELRGEATGIVDESWLDVRKPFEWTHLATGSYELVVAHPAQDGQRWLRHRQAYRLDVPSSGDGIELSIPPGRVLSLRPSVETVRVGSEGLVTLRTLGGAELVRQSLRLASRGAQGEPRFEELVQEWAFGIVPRDVERFELKLVPDGRYRLRVEFEGYRAVDREVVVEGDTALDLELESISGRMVALDSADDYLRLDVRAPGDDGAWKTLLEWDARSRASHSIAKGSKECFLESGTHDLRIVSTSGVPKTMESVKIEDAEESLVLRPRFERGLAMRGNLLDRLGRPLARRYQGRVHLLRRSGLVWAELPEHASRLAWPSSFEFRGLLPGAYRIALDPDGVNAVANVRLEDRDLRLELRY